MLDIKELTKEATARFENNIDSVFASLDKERDELNTAINNSYMWDTKEGKKLVSLIDDYEKSLKKGMLRIFINILQLVQIVDFRKIDTKDAFERGYLDGQLSFFRNAYMKLKDVMRGKHGRNI